MDTQNESGKKVNQTSKSLLRKTFEDDNGNMSSMRVMSFIALLAAIGLAIAPFISGQKSDPIHVLYFLIGAFAPKAVQKFAERKI